MSPGLRGDVRRQGPSAIGPAVSSVPLCLEPRPSATGRSNEARADLATRLQDRCGSCCSLPEPAAPQGLGQRFETPRWGLRSFQDIRGLWDSFESNTMRA